MSIKSPCIGLCKLANEVCIGCFRTKSEISEWFTATEQRKLKILERIKNDTN